jgi:ketosteroid isomerase-like protein
MRRILQRAPIDFGRYFRHSKAMTDDDAILAANTAYYNAFVAGDYDRMCGIWAEDQVSCVHPGWPVLVGRDAILESYRSILNNPNQAPIKPHNATPLVSGDDGRVFCVEIVGGMALAATNWFRRIGGIWRMIHHQASPIATQVELDTERRSPSRLN